MKSLRNFIIALAATFGCIVYAQAQKYALVDMEYILKNIPAYERANEQLNQQSKKWQAEVEAVQNQAQTTNRFFSLPSRKNSANRQLWTKKRKQPN